MTTTPCSRRRSWAALSLLGAVAWVLWGCAYTTVKNDAGMVVLHTQADAADLYFKGGPAPVLHIQGMTHSTPTLAGGAAFSQGTNAVGGAAAAAVLAAGTSGLFNAGVATSSKALIVPTAAVATTVASKPKVPVLATPAPVRPVFATPTQP